MNIIIARDGSQLGEWTEEQVKTFYREGHLLGSDLYWHSGMTEWKSLANSSLISSGPRDRAADNSPVAPGSSLCPGFGTASSPFMLPFFGVNESVRLQRDVVDEVHGHGFLERASRTYSDDGSRIVWTFPGTNKGPIHFDSSAVTAFANSPQAAAQRQAADKLYQSLKPADKAKMDQLMRATLASIAPQSQPRSGCFSVVLVLFVAGAAIVVHLT